MKFALYFGNRGFMPAELIKSARTDMIKAVKTASRSEITRKISELEKQMKQAAKEFDFERAAELRDIILEIKAEQ